jgi:tight adherence protein B
MRFSSNGAAHMFEAAHATALITPAAARIIAVALAGTAGACLAIALLRPHITNNVRRAPDTRMADRERAKLRRRLARSPIALANRQAGRHTLGARLHLAGWNMTPQTFVALQLAAGLCTSGGLMPLLHSPPLAVLGGALCGALVPRAVLAASIRRRQRRFARHFGDAVRTLLRGATAGLPFNRCLQLAAEASQEPVRGALRRLAAEIIAGIPSATALDTFTSHCPAPETRIFAFTLALQYETGGSAARALGNLTDALLARSRFTQQLKTLTAGARVSALIIGALPFLVGGGIMVSSPDYLEPLWANPTGRVCLYLGAGWMLAGFIVMHRLTRLDTGQ